MYEPSKPFRMAEFAQYMNFKKLPKSVVGALLVGVTASTFAVTLGRMRGTAIVGRAFDVTLMAQLGSNERLPGLCVDAEVFFGDNLISPGRVSTALAAGANPGEVLIRVRTSSAVDEPVVTVNVREGCLQKNTRKYVFLAEVLTGKAGDLAVTSGEVTGTAPVLLPLVGGADGNPARSAVSASAVPAAAGSFRKRAVPDNTGTAKTPDKAADRLGGLSARLTAKAALESAGKSSRSRLKLDLLEPGTEREPILRASSELLTLPSGDPQQRASAAALWQALNAQPQEMLRDGQRLKALEMDVARMLTQSRMTDKAVSDLRVQLEQSRSERFSNWLVYTLAALLFLTWLTAAYLWTRNRREHGEERSSPWWRKGLGPDDRAAMDVAPQGLAGASREDRPAHPGVTTPGRFEPGFGFDGADPLFETARGSSTVPPAGRFKTMEPLAARDRTEFSISLPSMTGMPRIVNAEELFDVQQQADFFVSLGDFDKAIEVLRHHIADNVETSALAYLDLFDLYHQLGRKTDYETLSEEFNRTFNAQVPAFASYQAATQGLESYTAALSRIVSLWPTPKVLEVIEESIFRKPDSRSEVFSLAAYRELLLLHAIAKRVVDPSDGQKKTALNATPKPATPGFAHTSIQPLSAQLQDLPKLPSMGDKRADATRPPASRHLGLDIDLSFDFIDPLGMQADAAAGPGTTYASVNAPASFTHELLEFEMFPVDRSAR